MFGMMSSIPALLTAKGVQVKSVVKRITSKEIK